MTSEPASTTRWSSAQGPDPDPGRWERIEAYFTRLQQAEADEQQAIFDELDQADPTLRAEVETMLEASADRMLLDSAESASLSAMIDESSAAMPTRDPLLGRAIGPYHIESIIAHGGMGVVYRAVQSSPRRLVAIKFIRRVHGSHRLLRRFRLEVEVLSRLHHPYIAQVYDAGVHDEGHGGTPYFVMEYLPDAKPITTYAREQALDVDARLQLFLKACDAVHHGHQRGVIHRDLKPANILVDAVGTPKIIDFGVARSTDADIAVTTIETDIGQLVGTVQYMSPEQVDGDPHEIDTRSDIYSLGVVLYELLAGEPPYRVSGTSIFLATQMIREAEPKPLTHHARPLPRDLDAIVHRALAKDRTRRYQSAEAMARDIERYLDGQPVEARRPGSWRRSVYWLGRHPIIATCAAWLVLILGIVLGITWREATYRGILVDELEQYVIVHDLRGNELTRWRSSVGTHGVIPADRTNGRGRLLYVRDDATSEHGGAAQLYDLQGDLNEPAIVFRLSDSQLPTSITVGEGKSAAEFGIVAMHHADVYPELPGDELILFWTHGMGPGVLEVRDLNGQVHFQILHDGILKFLSWNAREGVIIAGGLDIEDTIGNWTGQYDLHASKHPPIVAILRPERGRLHKGFIKSRPEREGLPIEGYYWLQPMVDSGFMGIRPSSLPPTTETEAIAALSMDYYFDRTGGRLAPHSNMSYTIHLDAAGRIISQPSYAVGFSEVLNSSNEDYRNRVFPLDHFWFSSSPIVTEDELRNKQQTTPAD